MKKKEENKADISEMQDLSMAVMHLISIEEHLAFTAMKTGKKEYLVVQKAIRKMRVRLLKKLLKNTEGELWCTSKHLLSATMRLMETSAKFAEKSPEESAKMAKDSFEVYKLFWLLQEVK